MKRYSISVNGKAYDVAVEEISGGNAPAPVAAPAVAPAPAAAPAAPAAAVSGTEVKAPMPGNILDVKVKVGDKVENGTALVVLEAMKMENDVVAPTAGTVASINVKKGDTVESGTLIAVIA